MKLAAIAFAHGLILGAVMVLCGIGSAFFLAYISIKEIFE